MVDGLGTIAPRLGWGRAADLTQTSALTGQGKQGTDGRPRVMTYGVQQVDRGS